MERNEQLTVGDWISSLPKVLAFVRSNPVEVTAAMCCPLAFYVPVLNTSPILLILASSILMARLTCKFVHDLAGKELPADSKARRRIMIQTWLMDVEYHLGVYLFTMLLFLPGLLWAVNRSLGVIFICAEGKDSLPALTESACLLKGNFWRALRYLGLVPTIYIGAELIIPWALGDSSPVAGFFGAVFAILSTLVYLSILPLQYKLYETLRDTVTVEPQQAHSQYGIA